MDQDSPYPSDLNAPKSASLSLQFNRLRQIIFQPAQVFSSITSQNNRRGWLFPILVVSILIICAALVSTFLAASSTTPAVVVRTTPGAQTTRTVTTNRNSNQGGQIPGGGTFPGGDMPAPQMGGGFVGGFPGGTTTNNSGSTTTTSSSTSSGNIWMSLLWPVASFLITWLLTGGLTNLFSLAFGGASNAGMALTLAAWSSIPVGVRNLAQIIYYLASGQAIKSPGLSGFLTSTNDNALLIFTQFLLARIDIYLFWQIGLLALGVGIWGALARRKAVVIAALVVVLVVVLQSLVGMGVDLLGNVNINTNLLLRMR